MANQNKELQLSEERFDFDELEKALEQELDAKTLDLELATKDREKIGNPISLAEATGNVAWEQFMNLVGPYVGEDFVKENRGLTLDLRDDAHIQTAENFAKGIFPSRNKEIYKKRYEDWQANFQKDENNNIKINSTRMGTQEATLVKGARDLFDKDRPKGSVEKGTDMDHTVSAGEIIRDPAANAFLTKKEQIAFANSEVNLNEMDAKQNRSKGDKSMTDWLDNPNSKGQKPTETFDISKKDEQKYREKDAEARAEYNRLKDEGEKQAIKLGKKSQREEALRIGGEAVRAAIMTLLAALMKEILQKLVVWFRSAKKSISTFMDSLKESVKSFLSNLKQYGVNVLETVGTTVFSAIIGPIMGTIKKSWVFLKQGYRSLKKAINFFKDPKNQNMPFSIKVMEVSKIITAGLTAGGAILLSEAIEKGLMAFPIFAYPIPLLGSLASLLGLFFGALISGIIGAIALNLIDKLIASTQRELADKKIIEAGNEVLAVQSKQIEIAKQRTAYAKEKARTAINNRHAEAANFMKETITDVKNIGEQIAGNKRERQTNTTVEDDLQAIYNLLNK
ncbi:hypothetical protein [Phascolarctobacterium succinatutens]|uniref:hypothetical protein n=1 Tax=Phascolarctobacterium succinatutens TaxID=626940 RepID=UPI0023F97B76|nr:hypothetical protein [Phascolarctobacterium succinatutens]